MDVCIVGCGPAGLCLAYQLAQRGVSVGLVGIDAPFVNNYGVWVDEFDALDMSEALDFMWADAACFFGPNDKGRRVGRKYGRVNRAQLRSLLLKRCKDAGVSYSSGEAVSIAHDDNGSTVSLADGSTQRAKV